MKKISSDNSVREVTRGSHLFLALARLESHLCQYVKPIILALIILPATASSSPSQHNKTSDTPHWEYSVAASPVNWCGIAYSLLQFHFHSPSEHARDGGRFAMEVRLAHKSADGILAVVGVFMKYGNDNPTLQRERQLVCA